MVTVDSSAWPCGLGWTRGQNGADDEEKAETRVPGRVREVGKQTGVKVQGTW